MSSASLPNGSLVSWPELAAGLVGAARASGQPRHSSAQMTELLRQAGYTNPAGNTTSYHPLLHKLRRNLSEVRGATTT